MTEIEIKNKLDPLLKDLNIHKNLEAAENLISELMKLIGVETSERKLLNIAKVDYEIHRFQSAPSFLKQAAAYEIPNNKNDLIDLKLYWLKKTTKTNLSWVVGLTPNFEDSAANDFENISIDFVVPESGDSLIILLSQQYKIRSLEIKDHITSTQAEIFKTWSSLKLDAEENITSIKASSHAKLWDSFNFEPINKKFYLELVESFSLLVHHLEVRFDKKPSVIFTTRLIGRLLFIWFLKKKGLINTAINYFNVNDYESQNEFYKESLEVLFFKVLNQEIEHRTNGDTLTPYLNGGLFDENSTDFYKNPNLTFPNGFFNQLFNVLNKYNFTVDESSPEFQHVAIDPEMLGRIFESLLAEQIDDLTGNNKKKATGAFYTPREIVNYMCEESLIQFLKLKLPYSPDKDRRIEELIRLPEAIFRDQDSNKRRDWKPYVESILKIFEGSDSNDPITILDPAVGSGAFPMGMLQILVKIFSRLDVKYEKNISQLKRNILSRSLYGVDIEQTAIEICRLRAWLSIIVDIVPGDKIEPLPNLDFKFASANALISLDDDRQKTFFTDPQLKEKLMSIRNNYFNSIKKNLKAKLQDEYIKLTQNEDLFDSKRTKQLKSYRPFDVSICSEFYDPELHHGVSSFDIIIGNPPYIGEKGHKEIFKLVKESDLGNYYLGKMDYFYFFFHLAINLCKPLGIISFITTNYYPTALGARKLREDFKNRAAIRRLINFNEFRIFKSALGQHNLITILSKGSDPSVETTVTIADKNKDINNDFALSNILNGDSKLSTTYKTSQNDLYDGRELYIRFNNNSSDSDLAIQNLLNKIKSEGILLKDIFNVNNGIFSGSDKLTLDKKNKYNIKIDSDSAGIFILTNEEINNLNLNNLEKELIKPFFKNSDINRYVASNSNNINLINLRYTDRPNINDYPNIKKYLETFKSLLEDRPKTGTLESAFNNGFWYVLSTSRKLNFDGPKIIFPQRSKINTFAYNEIPWYGSADIYYITSSENSNGINLKYILGLLNSRLFYLWLYHRGKRKGETLELYGTPISEIPIKIVDESVQEKFVSLIDQIILRKQDNPDSDISIIQKNIDSLIYEIYSLNNEDILLIENSTKNLFDN
jgi:adenine-specific DNA-methyltransferase